MKYRLNGLDEYEIMTKSVITDFDRRVLLRLYQPITGFGAITFYLTLWSELEGEKTITTMEKQHERLFNIMQATNGEILKYREKLEAVGLLKTFVKPTDHETNLYLYKLLSPMSPHDFYQYELFVILLKNALDNREYERTKVYFTPVPKSLQGYEELTASFKDAFPTLNLDDEENLGYLAEVSQATAVGKHCGKPRLEFDLTTFYEGLKSYQIRKKDITSELENEIVMLASAYQISAFDMRNVVSSCLSSSGEIDIEQLRRRARQFSTINNKRKEVSEPLPKDKGEPSLSGNEILDGKLQLLEEFTPIEFLKVRNHNKEPLNVDKELVMDLQRTGLPDSVINVILDYSLMRNDNRLVNKYVEKIASTMQRNNIKTAQDAMVELNKKPRSRKAVTPIYGAAAPENKATPSPQKIVESSAGEAEWKEKLRIIRESREK